MSDTTSQLLAVYATASAGDPEAYVWLVAFHGWSHRIDDHIDEQNQHAAGVVDLCRDAVVLCCSGFFRRHAATLGPLLAVVAEKYHASLSATGRLADVLRLAGNDVVLAVAYIRGGTELVRQVSEALWPIVHRTQLLDIIEP